MHSGEGLDFKANSKANFRKLYPNPSAQNLIKKQGHHREVITGGPKPTRARHTDHTDEQNSQRSQSYFVQPENYNTMGDEIGESYAGFSRVSNNGYGNESGIRLLSEKEEKVVELRERLKNIHHFYRIRIEEERSKNIERNQIFIGIIQELQRNHSERISNCRKALEQMQEEKQELGYVDDRMGNIKSTIEQILLQSKDLKESNEEIEKELLKKEVKMKDKEAELMEQKQEINTMREKLEQFERLKLKENKRNKELLEMIEQIHN